MNKNRIGDCFLIFQKDVFPSTVAPGSLKAYRDFIVRLIKPYLGVDFNTISILEVSSKQMLADHNGTIAARINAHFKGKLNLFYVDSHEEISQILSLGSAPMRGIVPTLEGLVTRQD